MSSQRSKWIDSTIRWSSALTVSDAFGGEHVDDQANAIDVEDPRLVVSSSGAWRAAASHRTLPVTVDLTGGVVYSDIPGIAIERDVRALRDVDHLLAREKSARSSTWPARRSLSRCAQPHVDELVDDHEPRPVIPSSRGPRRLVETGLRMSSGQGRSSKDEVGTDPRARMCLPTMFLNPPNLYSSGSISTQSTQFQARKEPPASGA